MLLPLLNYLLDIPNDIVLMAVQFLGGAALIFLALSSEQEISDALAASSVFHAVPVMTTLPVVEDFSDFLPAILTPPPNPKTVF